MRDSSQGCYLKQDKGESFSCGWVSTSKLLHSFFKGPRGLECSVQPSPATFHWGLKLRAVSRHTMLFLTKRRC